MPFNRNGLEPYEGIEDYIFISYAHSDGDVIFPILRKMKEAGFRFWYDDGIEPGSEWPESIAHHLASAKICMAFLSPASAKSRNCRREINYALAKELDFLSVVLEHVELTPGLEMQISTYQSIMYTNHQNPDDVLRRLLQMANLKSCRQPAGGTASESGEKPVLPEKDIHRPGSGQAGTTTGMDWVENPIPMPQAETQEAEVITSEASETEAPVNDGNPEEEKKEAKQEEKRVKKDRKSVFKKEKKREKATVKNTENGEPAKKKGKKILLAFPLLLAVLAGIFAGRSLLRPKVKIGDKVYENNNSYQDIKDAELTAGNLKTLSRFSKCRTLVLENCSLPEGSMETLAKMSGLSHLQLLNCSGIENLKPLATLTQMNNLEVIGCSLDDSMLEGFTGSGSIRQVDFSNNALTKLPVLSGAEKITTLNLAKNNLQDLAGLSSYTSLVSLDLSENNLTDLDGFTLPEKLETFLADNNQLSSIDVLTDCIRLKKLGIAGNHVENLSALVNMTLLENVNLAENSALTDFSFLKKNAGTMKRLNISGISLADNEETMASIGVCTGMQALDLSGCGLTRTDFLENLKQLRWLDLADNAIEKVEGISSHKELVFLNLTNNALTEMTGLPAVEEPRYPGVYWLLHGNRISTLYDNKCGDIAVLDISGNNVTDFSSYRRKSVRSILFEVNAQTDLASVKSVDSFRNYYVLAIPADRKVEFEDKVSRSGVYTSWEEALEETAGNMLAFTFDR